MTYKADRLSLGAVGNAGITPFLQEEGYLCTLCFVTSPLHQTSGGDAFVDVHVTREQAEDLVDRLQHFLKLHQEEP